MTDDEKIEVIPLEEVTEEELKEALKTGYIGSFFGAHVLTVANEDRQCLCDECVDKRIEEAKKGGVK